MSPSSSPKVLLIAEAANPEWSSVPLVGWSHARALARHADVHVVTQVRNQAAFERQGLREGVDFTAIDSEALARPLWRLSDLVRRDPGRAWTVATAFTTLSYPYFEWLVWQRFGDRIRAGEFDLVHRLTPLTPTSPSPLAGWCDEAGVPFVLGPLNGGVPWPRAFDSVRRAEGELLSYVRGVYRWLPWYGATRDHARAIIVGSIATRDQMPPRHRGKCVYIPENAVDPSRFDLATPRARDPSLGQRPLRGVFVGRLVPYKGVDMAIEAAAPFLRRGEMTFDVIGDGPEKPAIDALVERLGVVDAVTLPGWIPHDELGSRFSHADVLVFPSVREFGGAVVLEAMALGVVPIVAAYGGPDELVTDDSGWRIPLRSRQELIAGFHDCLARLVDDPSPVPDKAEAARARVRRSFTWDAKARQVAAVYDWVLGRGPQPDFGAPLRDG